MFLFRFPFTSFSNSTVSVVPSCLKNSEFEGSIHPIYAGLPVLHGTVLLSPPGSLFVMAAELPEYDGQSRQQRKLQAVLNPKLRKPDFRGVATV